jgi:hypothetical protein
MEVDERPTDTYTDIGGLDKQIEELVEAMWAPSFRFVVALPLTTGAPQRSAHAASGQVQGFGYHATKGMPDVWSTW